MSESKMIFSKNLKLLLDRNNISQVELSKILGVSESSVGKWLLQKSMPRMNIIEKLAQYFQVDTTYFFKETDKNSLELTARDERDIKKHLDKFKKVITSDNAPYGLHRARKESFFNGEKIIAVRKCVDRPIFSYVDFNSYVSATFYVIKPANIDLKYLTGILNSKLIAFWLKNKGKMQGSNYQVDKEPLLNIPIVNTKDEKVKSKLVKLVDNIIAINKKLVGENNPNTKEILERQVRALDGEIDRLVYGLYGLTDEEVGL